MLAAAAQGEKWAVEQLRITNATSPDTPEVSFFFFDISKRESESERERERESRHTHTHTHTQHTHRALLSGVPLQP